MYSAAYVTQQVPLFLACFFSFRFAVILQGEYHANNQQMAKLLHKAIGLGKGSNADPEAYKAYQVRVHAPSQGSAPQLAVVLAWSS